MKKLLLTMALLGAVFTVSACSENKDVASDESSELLANPEVTQASTKESESANGDSGTDETGKALPGDHEHGQEDACGGAYHRERVPSD